MAKARTMLAALGPEWRAWVKALVEDENNAEAVQKLLERFGVPLEDLKAALADV
ncbi:MAG: hypothetical protein ABSC73_09320 [Acidimicrobiales bacterium]|jgi:hypothetical protein